MLDLLFGFLLPIPETETSYTFSSYIWAPSNAPIHIEACEGSAEVLRGIAQKSTLNYGSGFTITGQQPATRVRLRFTFTDDHWQPLSTKEVDVSGRFTPGVKILRTHRYGGNFTQHTVIHNAAALLCSPISITFEDGSHWSWTPPSTPSLQITPTPSPSIDYD